MHLAHVITLTSRAQGVSGAQSLHPHAIHDVTCLSVRLLSLRVCLSSVYWFGEPANFYTCCVKTTPQMTRFLDAKVCSNWLQIRIDDHRIQSDFKYKSELQNPEGKKSVFGIASAW